MAGSKDDAAKRRQAAGPGKLPPEMLANIHDRMEFLDRIAFATVFAASCDDIFSLPTPWLLLPCDNDKDPVIATLFSVADRRAATVRAPDPALRDYIVLGSSHGWLATGDNRGQIHLINPATGEQHALPDIATMGVFVTENGRVYFSVWIKRFLTARFGGGPLFGDNCWRAEGHGGITYSADDMHTWFYRKAVLSIGRRPERHVAMLILNEIFGAPAFTTAEDGGAWRLAQSRDGIEDAIHHGGRFHSVSYSGVVEAWERDAESGAYTSTAVAPRLTAGGEGMSSHKYIVAAPDGRLMVVVKYWTKEKGYLWNKTWTCSFQVHILSDDGKWTETRDIGDAALFIGLNNSLCVPKMRHPEIEAGCVYYTDDQLWEAAVRKRNKDIKYRDDDDDYIDVWPVGVYSLKDGTVKKIDALGPQQYRGFTPMPPVWITPSIP
ncbi:hypothetical protein ACQ4PT_053254 [Festuca glaucescens]